MIYDTHVKYYICVDTTNTKYKTLCWPYKNGEVNLACVLPFHCFQALHVGEEEINMNFFDRK